MTDATHASFFSGAGGLDIGLERAGWRTVSFSEIDPYASAVLAQRWPGVVNFGDIVRLPRLEPGAVSERRPSWALVGEGRYEQAARDAREATLWSGGFPCQDLSVAGKRRGLAGSRSGLAFAFLDLVGRHRPRFVLLENVPGLLSSHGGKDFGTLLAAMVELGYGVGYRVLDARYFGVPQRRRRVFILGDSLGGRAGAEFAAEVLSVGSRCHRHPPAGIEAGPGAAAGVAVGAVLAREGKGAGHNFPDDHLVSASPDSRGVRAPDGLAGRSHDRDGVVNALDQPRGGADDNEAQAGHLVAYVKHSRYGENGDPRRPDSNSGETWGTGELGHSLDAIGHAARTATAIVGGAGGMTDDPLLPLGLDSHRYRCCGNGVVADVGEWIGRRLLEVM